MVCAEVNLEHVLNRQQADCFYFGKRQHETFKFPWLPALGHRAAGRQAVGQ